MALESIVAQAAVLHREPVADLGHAVGLQLDYCPLAARLQPQYYGMTTMALAHKMQVSWSAYLISARVSSSSSLGGSSATLECSEVIKSGRTILGPLLRPPTVDVSRSSSRQCQVQR